NRMAGFSMRLSLYQFRTRYRPSLFPVIQEPKAHQVGQADCVFFADHPSVQAFSKKSRRLTVCSGTYAVARSFQESE
ncbi:hypothetical protein N8Q72_23830, partial [Enterobacter hormaechei subsp. steigerwaltii]|nr:hypothetical protein [Enterobacter hormaechei subsp. steigerwaltii]MCU2664409.1 hypothetical protein [Enterobacter hormaechei subsp. steigerwaltii]MCU2980105.1 hypothetical protein [Enterobacter hormaechei subsp. steigerwaltii]MCU3098172.1 hypothetical protein [Enterobacter hormaechei subsp. steigerwaltii]MCU3220027.1 hypothetical protein [Enterobacter hormaechei subsp. steigerwaltii]